MDKVYKDSKVPLYMQLFHLLLRKIQQSLKPGDRLDPELTICRKYSVSRTTVRQALLKLEQEGYIYRIHGSGHFVAQHSSCHDFHGMFCQGGLLHTEEEEEDLTCQILGLQTINVCKDLATCMQVKDGLHMFKRERLLFQCDLPLIYEIVYLPAERFYGLESKLLYNLSPSILLEKHCAAQITGISRYFQPVLVGEEASKHLKISPNQPALQIEQFLYEDGKLLAYILGVTRGDKFKYRCILASEYSGTVLQ